MNGESKEDQEVGSPSRSVFLRVCLGPLSLGARVGGAANDKPASRLPGWRGGGVESKLGLRRR